MKKTAALTEQNGESDTGSKASDAEPSRLLKGAGNERHSILCVRKLASTMYFHSSVVDGSSPKHILMIGERDICSGAR